MDQKSRKSIYEVVGIRNDNSRDSITTINKLTASNEYDRMKHDSNVRTVLFCTTTPTVTKGQIDPDIV